MADHQTHDEWNTPPWLVSVISGMGPIGLDPCTSIDNPTGAERFFTAHDDGLAYAWTGRGLIYCNPPYSLPLVRKFTDKMAETEFGPDDCGLLLLPGKTDTNAFHTAMQTCDLACLFSRRIKFDGEGGNWLPRFGSVMFGFWSNARVWHPRFCEAFKNQGSIIMKESKSYY